MDNERQTAHQRPFSGPRGWLRFRMRTLLVVVALVGVWLGWHVNRAERQRRAVDAIRSLGGEIRYSFDMDPDSEGAITRRLRELFGDHHFGRASYVYSPPEATRRGAAEHLPDLYGLNDLTIQVLLGDDLQRHLPHIAQLPRLRYLNLESTLLNDEGLAMLAGMTTLEHLDIGYNLPITDAGLPHLYGLKRLKQLRAFRTSASDAAMRDLEAALPECKVWW
jgi:hypothetical protein